MSGKVFGLAGWQLEPFGGVGLRRSATSRFRADRRFCLFAARAPGGCRFMFARCTATLLASFARSSKSLIRSLTMSRLSEAGWAVSLGSTIALASCCCGMPLGLRPRMMPVFFLGDRFSGTLNLGLCSFGESGSCTFCGADGWTSATGSFSLLQRVGRMVFLGEADRRAPEISIRCPIDMLRGTRSCRGVHGGESCVCARSMLWNPVLPRAMRARSVAIWVPVR
jgi:hypothetical protein